jgi:hypothetical protein
VDRKVKPVDPLTLNGQLVATSHLSRHNDFAIFAESIVGMPSLARNILPNRNPTNTAGIVSL